MRACVRWLNRPLCTWRDDWAHAGDRPGRWVWSQSAVWLAGWLLTEFLRTPPYARGGLHRRTRVPAPVRRHCRGLWRRRNYSPVRHRLDRVGSELRRARIGGRDEKMEVGKEWMGNGCSAVSTVRRVVGGGWCVRWVRWDGVIVSGLGWPIVGECGVRVTLGCGLAAG